MPKLHVRISSPRKQCRVTEAWERGRGGFWCLLCPYSELRVPARAVLVYLWFLYLFFPCFRICFVLRFSLLFSHLILIRAFQRRWLSPGLSYRLGAEEVRGLVSSVERLQMAQLEFKPGSLALPSAETSSDLRIRTQNSLPEHSLQSRVLRTAFDSSIVSHLVNPAGVQWIPFLGAPWYAMNFLYALRDLISHLKVLHGHELGFGHTTFYVGQICSYI